MRISWRPSGSANTPGRGEYEISEPFRRLTPTDLLGRTVRLNFGSGLEIDTQTRLTDQGRKRRLRRIGGTGIQLHRQFAAAMLMPNPSRDARTWEQGAPVMNAGHYGIVHINFPDVRLTEPNAVLLAVEEAQLRNVSFDAELLQFRQRLEKIQRI